MARAFVPDDYDCGLVTEPMTVVVIDGEIVLDGGHNTIVLDAFSAAETGRRLLSAAEQTVLNGYYSAPLNEPAPRGADEAARDPRG